MATTPDNIDEVYKWMTAHSTELLANLANFGYVGPTAFVIASDAPAKAVTYAQLLQANGHPVWVCDATTDDVEIQAALASLPSTGGNVRLSSGTFYLANYIDMPDDYDNLWGAGMGATTIRPQAGVSAIDLIHIGRDAASSGPSVRDLTVDGINSTLSGVGIQIRSVNDTEVLRNIMVKNCGSHGVYVTRTAISLSFNKVDSWDNIGDGFRFDRTQSGIYGIKMYACRAYMNGAYGLYLNIDVAFLLSGLILEGSTTRDLYIQRGYDIEFNHLDMEGPGITIPATATIQTGNIKFSTVYLYAQAGVAPMLINYGVGVTFDGVRMYDDNTACDFAGATINEIKHITCNIPPTNLTSARVFNHSRCAPIAVIRNEIAALLNLLGDVRYFLPMHETTGTTISDVSSKGHNFTASPTLANWTSRQSNLGKIMAHTFTPADTPSFSVADHADFTTVGAACTWGFIVGITTSGVANLVIASKWKSDDTQREWRLLKQSDMSLDFYLIDEDDATNGYLRFNSAVLGVSTSRVIVTWDGSGDASGLLMYINGVLDASTPTETGTFNSVRDGTAKVCFGTYDGGTPNLTDGVSLSFFAAGALTAVQVKVADSIMAGLVNA